MYIKGSKNVTSVRNTYNNCSSSSQGGVYTLISSVFSDLNSTFHNNSANLGGVISCSSYCNASVSNSEFTYNLAENGGVFLFDNVVYANLTNLTLNNDFSFSDGGVLSIIKSDLSLMSESEINIKNCSNISHTKASDAGGFAAV